MTGGLPTGPYFSTSPSTPTFSSLVYPDCFLSELTLDSSGKKCPRVACSSLQPQTFSMGALWLKCSFLPTPAPPRPPFRSLLKYHPCPSLGKEVPDEHPYLHPWHVSFMSPVTLEICSACFFSVGYQIHETKIHIFSVCHRFLRM